MICKRISQADYDRLFESMAPDPGGLGVYNIDALMRDARSQDMLPQFRRWLAPRVNPDARFIVRSWCED